jgi:hypothetical protein
MRIFSATPIRHDVHGSSAPGIYVRRAYPVLKYECERVPIGGGGRLRDQCQKTPITIQISVQRKN